MIGMTAPGVGLRGRLGFGRRLAGPRQIGHRQDLRLKLSRCGYRIRDGGRNADQFLTRRCVFSGNSGAERIDAPIYSPTEGIEFRIKAVDLDAEKGKAADKNSADQAEDDLDPFLAGLKPRQSLV